MYIITYVLHLILKRIAFDVDRIKSFQRMCSNLMTLILNVIKLQYCIYASTYIVYICNSRLNYLK